MAVDPELEEALRAALTRALGEGRPAIDEKRMMGGTCFMLNGNMVCGADRANDGQRRYMFRTGKGNPAAAALPGGEEMVMGGRVMGGMYFVDFDACGDTLLDRWLGVAIDHARSLPAK